MLGHNDNVWPCFIATAWGNIMNVSKIASWIKAVTYINTIVAKSPEEHALLQNFLGASHTPD